DQGGLTGAVGAHENGDLARLQREIDAAEHLVGPESLGQTLNAERGVHGHVFLPSGRYGECHQLSIELTFAKALPSVPLLSPVREVSERPNMQGTSFQPLTVDTL